jgi:hypothetical protein
MQGERESIMAEKSGIFDQRGGFSGVLIAKPQNRISEKLNGRLSNLVTPLLVGISLIATSCTPLHYFPVQGPLASQNPPVVLRGKITGPTSGPASITLPDGEVCSGHWSFSPPPDASNSMASVWDTVYGQGYYVANVSGQSPFAHFIMTGDRGATVTVEFYGPHHKWVGVAKDSKGNIYKVTS